MVRAIVPWVRDRGDIERCSRACRASMCGRMDREKPARDS